jgi:hypothetical protein
MKALVVYESLFGNTETIARAIADGLAGAFTAPSAEGFDLLVAGAPTHAFGLSRPSSREQAQQSGPVRAGATKAGLREYLATSPQLTGLAAAVFDTRVDKPITGSAARKAHRRLHRLGCRMLVPPAGFRVAGTTGPLLAGEEDRARRWAAALATALRTLDPSR